MDPDIISICLVEIDSDSRFSSYHNPEFAARFGNTPMYMRLPYDEAGFNSITCLHSYNSAAIFYKGAKVLDMNAISHCYKGTRVEPISPEEMERIERVAGEVTGEEMEYDHYYFYVSTESDDDITEYYLPNTILRFAGHPMTHAHVHVKIIKKII